ncbi:type II secretion system F family protein [bacterium]|nr:type II secretion system F family protein [bacterium]
MPSPAVKQIVRNRPRIPGRRAEPGKHNAPVWLNRIRMRDISDFTRQLATMIQARMPLAKSLELLEKQQKNRIFKQIIGEIAEQVKSGKSLSDAFQAFQNHFGALYINMVRVGEVSGKLPELLQETAAYYEKMVQLRRKIRTALTYPAVVVLVAFGAIGFLLFGVMPTFQDMFRDFETRMPLGARLLLGASQWVQGHVYWILGGLVLITAGIRWFTHTEKGAWTRDRLRFSMPLVGPLVKKVSVARFTRTLSTLLQSGVSLLEALQVTARSSGNRVVESHVMQMRSMAARGEAMERSLASSSFFPDLVVQMIAVGEETAELPNMLAKTAEYYENEVDAALEALTSIIEPIIIVVLGVIVGGTIITIYMQIFDLMNVIE